MPSADLDQRRNASLAWGLCALVIGMLLLAYASVPLYRIFCQVTGFGGTTVQADAVPQQPGLRDFTVDFNTDVNSELPWEFLPLQKSVTLKPGEQKLVFFKAHNLSKEGVSGTAVFNVTPHKAGPYFAKTECFCFIEQRLGAGQEVTMPVSFFIDPEIENDPEMNGLHNITLSYTFFKTKQPNK